MPQTQMGVVRWVSSPLNIVARILPADDSELDNPAWTKLVIPTNPALELVKVARPAITLVGQTRIFLYAQDSPCQFPDPGNWNPNANRIEVLGSGQPGKAGIGEPVTSAGGGGGGGAYAVGVNVPVNGWPVGYTVFGPLAAGFAGISCVWGSTATTAGSIGSTPNVVRAEVAYGGTNTAPGGGGGNVYPTGFAGGSGGAGFSGTTNSPGGGGGGAGGPSGVGGNGGAATSTQFGAGGNANNNSVLGGFPASGNGHTGTEWGSIAGCGSGGAGAINSTTEGGGGGAFFGGGGGGGAQPASGSSGAGGGGAGLIVITYIPLPPGMQAQIMS
jgi:hypothetical protein